MKVKVLKLINFKNQNKNKGSIMFKKTLLATALIFSVIGTANALDASKIECDSNNATLQIGITASYADVFIFNKVMTSFKDQAGNWHDSPELNLSRDFHEYYFNASNYSGISISDYQVYVKTRNGNYHSLDFGKCS